MYKRIKITNKMKTKQFKLFFLLTMLMSMLGAKVFAYDAKIGGIYYNFLGTEASVTYEHTNNGVHYNDYSGNVVIPQSVTYNGTTYLVTSIGDYAFYRRESSLKSVSIPNSVTSIGDYAFYRCWGLSNITLPNSLTSIGAEAFYGVFRDL